MGGEMTSKIEDGIRRQGEKCDTLSGFIINCSLGGGCGSGLGALFLTKILEENYSYKMAESFDLFP